jgi:hypothetical protein
MKSDFNKRPLSAVSIVRERQNQNDLSRYKDIIKTRPSTVAAKEFFSDFNGDWLSLPQRCERLVKALDAWVSRMNIFLCLIITLTINIFMLIGHKPNQTKKQPKRLWLVPHSLNIIIIIIIIIIIVIIYIYIYIYIFKLVEHRE